MTLRLDVPNVVGQASKNAVLINGLSAPVNSVAVVPKRTMPTELLTLVGEVSAKLSW
jgi:hypothetical protein